MTDAAARVPKETEAGLESPGLRLPFLEDEKRGARRARLVKLVAVKLALDLVFVCGLAVYTHAVTYGRGFDGAIEHADGFEVSGWVVDLERPDAPVEVQLFVNGRFTASALAGEPVSDKDPRDETVHVQRPFVFRFEQPQYGEYQMRVYAVREARGGARRTLQQVGGPDNAIFK
jgi:hypothetical protein